MAADITLAELATRTTATREQPKVQPYELDAAEAGAAVDLGDARAVSLRIDWMRTQDSGLMCAGLDVVLESADAANGPWSRVPAQFGAIDFNRSGLGSETIGFVSPGQFLRARWTVRARGPRKLEARFSITGRAT